MQYPQCPKCKGVNVYEFEDNFICPDCAHEWTALAVAEEDAIPVDLVVKDANGAILQNGDTVVIIKSLPVKGFAHSIKVGTKVKNIKLTDGDHNIDCKIDGFGAMALKSEFVKKA
jgi:protein PhnA